MTSALPVALGDGFQHLPPALRAFHAGVGGASYGGTVTVQYGNSLLRLLSRLVGFPGPMHNRPMRMSIVTQGDHERWQRDFDGHILVSELRLLPGGAGVAERFGPIEVRMQPRVVEGGLDMPVTGIRMFGIPLPRWMIGPSGGQERASLEGGLTFCVFAHAVGIGPVIRYEGALAPVANAAHPDMPAVQEPTRHANLF
ncbi:DUF4166 domain-containing protein [Tateyamaria omphalii]|uniref:DUF4166 domain-containing protein n=1 Tax=Tateyamaria omphalii TaxID=299262 RepID=UPI001C990691|nr:DUF4166 domain-containing protein [Tateyamaria omphalii]MBY5931541.1 DUF4166 domain-containing protein [Tateyamaria omphalii]